MVEINDAGQIIGSYSAPGGQSHAFRYTTGFGLRDLGTLGGLASAPTGLNDKGDVVGSSTLADGSTHAFLWTAGDGMEDITALTGVPKFGASTTTCRRSPAPPPRLVPNVTRTVPAARTASGHAVELTAHRDRSRCRATASPARLDASSSIDDRPGVTYAWDLNKFPDGSATGQVVTVTYPHLGSAPVILTVTDAGGLTSSQLADVRPSPTTRSRRSRDSCTGLTCSFDAKGPTDEGGIV